MILLFTESHPAELPAVPRPGTYECSADFHEALEMLSSKEFNALIADFRHNPVSVMKFLEVAVRICPWLNCAALAEQDQREVIADAAKLGFASFIDMSGITEKNFDPDSLEENGIPNFPMSAATVGKYRDITRLTSSLLTGNSVSEMFCSLAEKLGSICPSAVCGMIDVEKNSTLDIYAPGDRTENAVKDFKEEIFDLFCTLKKPEREIREKDFVCMSHSPETRAPHDDSGPSRLLSLIPLLDEDGISGLFMAKVSESEFDNPKAVIPFSRHLFETMLVYSKLCEKITHDPLTGLYNHGCLQEELKKAWEKAAAKQLPLGFAIMDIDRFKNINDSYGHRVGDSIISELGKLIRKVTKRRDIVARYGGDEIAVILPGADSEKLKSFAARILETVRRNVFRQSGYPVHITVSIGSATNLDEGVKEEPRLIDLADKAMYLAKKRGRNQACSSSDLAQENSAADEGESPENAVIKTVSMPEYREKGRGKVLIVDDDTTIIKMLDSMLKIGGYEVTSTNEAAKALETVRSGPDAIDVLLTDINMPGMNGIELMNAVNDIDPNIVNVVITGFASPENTIKALRAGAYDLIPKPFHIEELQLIVDRAIERRRLKRQLDAYHVNLEEMLQDKTKALHEALENIKKSYVKTMEVIVTVLDIHEASTALHSRNVSRYAYFLACKMGIKNENTLRNIRYGALLHDIGKIGIPDAILKKPGPLTKEERKIINRHTAIGHKIVMTIPNMEETAEIVYSHHEKFDGTGYPRGLKGKDICLGARIFTIVDTFDALRSDRVYRRRQSLDFTIKEINRCSGSQFDPDIVRVFNTCCHEMDAMKIETDSFWDDFLPAPDETSLQENPQSAE